MWEPGAHRRKRRGALCDRQGPRGLRASSGPGLGEAALRRHCRPRSRSRGRSGQLLASPPPPPCPPLCHVLGVTESPLLYTRRPVTSSSLPAPNIIRTLLTPAHVAFPASLGRLDVQSSLKARESPLGPCSTPGPPLGPAAAAHAASQPRFTVPSHLPLVCPHGTCRSSEESCLPSGEIYNPEIISYLEYSFE